MGQNTHGSKALIIGGGLIGGEIARRLIEDGYEVSVVDRRDVHIPGVEHITCDILDRRGLDSCIVSAQPGLIVNSVNIATITSANPSTGYEELVGFYLGLYRSLSCLTEGCHFLQMGTTGSGGLGLNIPFTHGDALQDLPIINKAAFAGIGTMLLTLLSRSFLDRKMRISEIKPGLAIFATELRREAVGNTEVLLLDGGESGCYSYEELALLTNYMGYTTVDRIGDRVMAVLRDDEEQVAGSTDIIRALNGAIIASDAKDVASRERMLRAMAAEPAGRAVIVTGSLGPPEISRDLVLGAICQYGASQALDPRFWEDISRFEPLRHTFDYLQLYNKPLRTYLKAECTLLNYKKLLPFWNDGLMEGWLAVKGLLDFEMK